MERANLRAARIARTALPCLALVGLTGLAHAPSADTPRAPSRAVESLNFTGLAQFEFSEADEWTGGGTSTENTLRIGGWVTAPLGEAAGVRLALDGGALARSFAVVGGSHSSGNLLNTGGDIFLRDRERGYVQLGYRWNRAWWDGFRDDALTSDVVSSVHRIRYGVGLFHGDYDFEFGAEYLRLTGELTLTNRATGLAQTDPLPSNNGYRLQGGSTWYASDALALGLDLEWGRIIERVDGYSPDLHRDQFRARLGADWQPPVASLRTGATVGLLLGLGYNTIPVVSSVVMPPPGGTVFSHRDVYTFAYDVRLGVTLYFPGTSSLKERARQYQ